MPMRVYTYIRIFDENAYLMKTQNNKKCVFKIVFFFAHPLRPKATDMLAINNVTSCQNTGIGICPLCRFANDVYMHMYYPRCPDHVQKFT